MAAPANLPMDGPPPELTRLERINYFLSHSRQNTGETAAALASQAEQLLIPDDHGDLKAQIYLQIANNFTPRYNNVDARKEMARKRVAYYRKAQGSAVNRNFVSDASIGLGDARAPHGDPRIAKDRDYLGHYQAALDMANDPDRKARAHFRLGENHVPFPDPVKPAFLEHYREARRITGNRDIQAEADILLGNAHGTHIDPVTKVRTSHEHGGGALHYRSALASTQNEGLQARAYMGLARLKAAYVTPVTMVPNPDFTENLRAVLRLNVDPSLHAEALIELGDNLKPYVDPVSQLRYESPENYAKALDLAPQKKLLARARMGLATNDLSYYDSKTKKSTSPMVLFSLVQRSVEPGDALYKQAQDGLDKLQTARHNVHSRGGNSVGR